MALLCQIGSEASLGAFSKQRFVNGVLTQLSAVLNTTAGFVLRHPGCEQRRPYLRRSLA